MSKRSLRGLLGTALFFVGCSSIPEASGPHRVGTLRFDFAVDKDRTIEVRAFYPTEDAPPAHEREPTFTPALAEQMSLTFGIPKMAFSAEPSASLTDATPRAGSHPVLLFNHGFASFAKQNMTQFEDLASHGFVVMTLHHPGDTLVTTYDDGRVVTIDRTSPAYRVFERMQKNPGPTLREFRDRFEALRRAHDDPARHRALLQELAHSEAYADYGGIIDRAVADTIALINALPALPEGGSALQNSIDPARVGLFGHSLGGVVAGRVAQLDDRPFAVVTYDAPQMDYTAAGAPAPRQRVPTCFMYADAIDAGDIEYNTDRINDGLLSTAPTGSCSVSVEGAAHYNFSDMNNTAFLRFTSMLGEVDNKEMAMLLRDFTRAYFLHHLGQGPRPQSNAIAAVRYTESADVR